jgi:hypothetical protein
MMLFPVDGSCWALFALLVSIFGVICDASLDNKGDEFILGFLPNINQGGSVELHLTADSATNVEIEYPVGTSIETTTINPGTIKIISLPLTTWTSWTANVVAANLIRVTGSDEFVAYMVNRQPFTTDTALGLPVDTMNTEFIVIDYNPRFGGSQFLVYAAFDDTNVTITPTTNMVGRSAGTPFNVELNRGEGYYARSATLDATNSLTGTTISSTRPVGMANGNVCTQVPGGTASCDHIFEVAQPVQTWGLEIGVANLPQRPGGSIYRVVASEDSTAVTLDGTPLPNLLNAGEFYETGIIPGNHVFVGDKPIYVAQYMTGSSAPQAISGDPAMGNMIPFAQYLTAYTFSTVGGSQFITNYVTIIAETADIGNVLLDSIAVPDADFSPIPNTVYSAAVVQISEGTHTTSSPSPHGITVEGYNTADSYLYPGGALFQFINPINDVLPPIVTLNPPVGGSVNGLAQDNRVDDTGIFFIELSPDSVNLEVIASFIPADPEVNFIVQLIDPTVDGTGTVIVTDGAGNVSNQLVLITVTTCTAPPILTSLTMECYKELDLELSFVPSPDGPATTIMSVTVTGLPPGVTQTTTAPGNPATVFLQGTPDTVGSYTLNFEATDDIGTTTTSTLTINGCEPPLVEGVTCERKGYGVSPSSVCNGIPLYLPCISSWEELVCSAYRDEDKYRICAGAEILFPYDQNTPTANDVGTTLVLPDKANIECYKSCDCKFIRKSVLYGEPCPFFEADDKLETKRIQFIGETFGTPGVRSAAERSLISLNNDLPGPLNIKLKSDKKRGCGKGGSGSRRNLKGRSHRNQVALDPREELDYGIEEEEALFCADTFFAPDAAAGTEESVVPTVSEPLPDLSATVIAMDADGDGWISCDEYEQASGVTCTLFEATFGATKLIVEDLVAKWKMYF